MNRIQYPSARLIIVLLCMVLGLWVNAQPTGNCNTVQVTAQTLESRCTATGTISISATGGSGQFNYRVTGPINISYTSSNSISGLTPGTYTVYVQDFINGCVKQLDSVTISGSYEDPRFSLLANNISCKNAINGSMRAVDITGGRQQFWFTIVTAPQASDLGRSNDTGFFPNLAPGDYAVRMEDSCGGIQTRRVTILPYDWWIEASAGSMASCSTANLSIELMDSRGNVTPDSVFQTFQYGWVSGLNDTVWNASSNFTADIGNRRAITLVVKDGCGNVSSVPWINTFKPAVDANVTISATVCDVFTARVTGVVNMTNPQFCLFDVNYTQLACNTTGVFSDLPQDNYTVEIRDLCYDTLIRRNFSLVNPIPDVTASPVITRVNCARFNVQITGLMNFTNPRFCIFQNNIQLTCNNTGRFNNLANGTYEVRITDGCYDTTIVRVVDVQPLVPSVGANVSITNRSCTGFDVAMTGQTNLSSPVYSLWNNGLQIESNATGVFNGLLYGDYCIRVVNAASCFDTTIVQCFTGTPPIPSVGTNLSVIRDCDVIRLDVADRQNLTNPQYCLFDSSGNSLGCNGTGSFSDLPYGRYCIRIINDPNCYDTTIQRCITVEKQRPEGGAVSQSNANCLTFDAAYTGGSNITNPTFILQDSAGVALDSNRTGRFTNIPFGRYCIAMRNDPTCYDTTITSCFTGQRPRPSGGSASFSQMTCPTFSVRINGLVNITNPVFTLKDSSGNIVGSNTTGVFDSLSYQRYCMEIRNDSSCYDTVIVRCFNPTRPTPSIGAVRTSNLNCATFDATLNGQTLLTNPIYNLKDSAGIIIATNDSGIFTGLSYGRYSIEVIDGCYPNPLVRNFSASRPPLDVAASAGGGCEMGMTNLRIDLQQGSQPYIVTVFDPLNNVVGNVVSMAGLVEFRNLPALAPGMQYRVEVIDNCGRTGSQMLTPILSQINKAIQFTQRCPSGLKPNGSSDIVVTVSSNTGPVFPVIISQNGIVVKIPYSNQAGRTFTFIDLQPGTYVVMYNLPGGCSNKVYDTVSVNPYSYPVIANAAVYQCSNNSFTVSAAISGGAPSFQYQIIGSAPALPSINTGWQSSSVFTINNGASYSLVRLRAIDACGNAALNDANVLPLQNLVVTATSTCMSSTTLLQVDYVPNTYYRWYKMSANRRDSVYLGNSNSYTVFDVSPADTGLYKVTMTLNGGCLDREASFNLTGNCIILPAKDIRLIGERQSQQAALKWSVIGENQVEQYEVEHATSPAGPFKFVGTTLPKNPQGDNLYTFLHDAPVSGDNYYRIKVKSTKGQVGYSNVISLNWTDSRIAVYPVPASQTVYVSVSGKQPRDLRIQLFSLNGQLLQEKTERRVRSAQIPVQRKGYASGVYLVRITDLETGFVQTERIIFE
jgi:hypothetical protein